MEKGHSPRPDAKDDGSKPNVNGSPSNHVNSEEANSQFGKFCGLFYSQICQLAHYKCDDISM